MRQVDEEKIDQRRRFLRTMNLVATALPGCYCFQATAYIRDLGELAVISNLYAEIIVDVSDPESNAPLSSLWRDAKGRLQGDHNGLTQLGPAPGP